MTPTFFAKSSDFRQWLTKNHKKESELLVGFYTVGSGKPSMTWPQSVDEALCVGWIDGVRKSIDKESYSIRFTPRKPASIWSAVNIKKVEALTEKGLMQPAGIEAFEKRQDDRSRIYAYEKAPVNFTAEFEKTFKSNKMAWAFFTSQAPSYQRTITYWIMSAKQEPTRQKRLNQTIAESEKQNRIL